MESNPFVSNFSAMPAPGDYVVGRYNALGGAIEEGNSLLPDVKVQKLREAVAREAGRGGGRVLREEKVVKNRKKKTPPKPVKFNKVDIPRPTTLVDFSIEEAIRDIENPADHAVEEDIAGPDESFQISYSKMPQPPEKKLKITFSNDFGNIRVYAEDVLRCDNSLAIIFKNEEAVTFIPKTGETLSLKIEDEDPISVYFPGAIFTWTDQIKNIIILFKTNE